MILNYFVWPMPIVNSYLKCKKLQVFKKFVWQCISVRDMYKVHWHIIVTIPGARNGMFLQLSRIIGNHGLFKSTCVLV